MIKLARPLFLAALVTSTGVFSVGCSASTDEGDESSAAVSTGVHEPQGDERKAIYDAFRPRLTKELNGQSPIFNSKDPAGRFQAHGDYAYFEGILEGPNGNVTPLNYKNSIYQEAFEGGWLDGVQRNGHFAAKFFGLAHREANGKWKIVDGDTDNAAFAVGPGYDVWESWTSAPPPAQRDVFVAYPKDDLHEPQGEELKAILDVLKAQLGRDVNGQALFLNWTDPAGSFKVHDGYAYFNGIIEGPDGNKTPIDYSNSIYAASQSNGFDGLLRNGNFAAKCHALLVKQPNGSWKLAAASNDGVSTEGYLVGKNGWVGDPGRFSYDVFPPGDGNGDGDGDGNGNGGDGDGDGNGNGNGNGG
jgi:hypothetical protein